MGSSGPWPPPVWRPPTRRTGTGAAWRWACRTAPATSRSAGRRWPRATWTCWAASTGKRGCWMGQEVTARMHYRGLAKRRLTPMRVAGPMPAAGATVERNGVAVGECRSSAGGLVMVLAPDGGDKRGRDRLEVRRSAPATRAAGLVEGCAERGRCNVRRGINEASRSNAADPRPSFRPGEVPSNVISTGANRRFAERRNLLCAPPMPNGGAPGQGTTGCRFLHFAPRGAPVDMTAFG